jgi:hypothetical protein
LWVLGRLVAELNRLTRNERWYGLRLLAIDHTTLTLPETSALWKRFRSHRGKKGLGPVAAEFACVFHLVSRAPFFYTIAKASTSDHKLIRRLIHRLRKGDLVLIDNGFYYLDTLLRIRKRGAHFLIPAKTTHRPKVLKKLGAGDYLCRIRSGDQTLVVRVIYIERKGFRRRRLVTSLIDPNMFPAEEFSDLYHQRWGIETFYRDFKQTLRGTHWHCQSPKTFEQELVVHLILVCLIRRALLEAAGKAGVKIEHLSFARCLTQIRVFFRRLGRSCLLEFKHLYAGLIDGCAKLRVLIKPDRSFSRDRQKYRRKARGLEPKPRGRRPKPTAPCPPAREVNLRNCLLD